MPEYMREDAPSPLTFQQLRKMNSSRSKAWHKDVLWNLSDWGVALAGEAGEVCDAIKKLNRIRDRIQKKPLTKEQALHNLGDEIADTLLYLDLLAEAAGIDMEEVVKRKFNEISEQHKFPEKL